MKGITIYGASSPFIDRKYLDAAFLTGKLLAEAGVDVISGGGRTGIMASVTEGALSAGGAAIGVLPRFMYERSWQHPALTRLEITPDMHRRKEMMAELSCGAIAMPGGVGTLEELLEIITWRKLALYDGNVVILNIDGFYDPLLQMLERTIDQHFMNEDHAMLWSVAATPAEAVSKVLDKQLREIPFSQTIV